MSTITQSFDEEDATRNRTTIDSLSSSQAMCNFKKGPQSYKKKQMKGGLVSRDKDPIFHQPLLREYHQLALKSTEGRY
jgi:hypothetical protein